jgi:hypothetical protein
MTALPQPLRIEGLPVSQAFDAAEPDPRKAGLGGNALDRLFVICHRQQKV